ncbi:MAG: hypothetical protein ACJ79P_18730, partial [Myxococcales bacterium]
MTNRWMLRPFGVRPSRAKPIGTLGLVAALCCACAGAPPATKPAPPPAAQAEAQKPPQPAPTAQADAAAGESPPLLQLPRDVKPVRYSINMEIDPKKTRFRGSEDISVELSRSRSAV